MDVEAGETQELTVGADASSSTLDGGISDAIEADVEGGRLARGELDPEEARIHRIGAQAPAIGGELERAPVLSWKSEGWNG